MVLGDDLRYEEYVGMKVIYRSGSGKDYPAIIGSIPENPDTNSKYPIVNLIFKDIRGKYVKKRRVPPIDSVTEKLKVWIYDKGKHVWKNGLFVVDDEEAYEDL